MIFKPEDFVSFDEVGRWQQKLADLVNKKLETHLATLRRVYLDRSQTEVTLNLQDSKQHMVVLGSFKDSWFTALLWGIAEIEKKKCEHPANMMETYPSRPGEARCFDCGSELRAKWEAL